MLFDRVSAQNRDAGHSRWRRNSACFRVAGLRMRLTRSNLSVKEANSILMAIWCCFKN